MKKKTDSSFWSIIPFDDMTDAAALQGLQDALRERREKGKKEKNETGPGSPKTPKNTDQKKR